MPSNRYTCSLSQKSGAIVGNSTVIDFTTDVESKYNNTGYKTETSSYMDYSNTIVANFIL